MSSLRRRGRRWWLCYSQCDEQGGITRKQIPLIPPGQKMATTSKATAANLKKQFDQQQKSVKPKSLGDLLENYEQVNSLAGSPDQAKQNRRILCRLIDHFALTHAVQIDQELIQKWMQHLRQQGRERGTLANHLSAISTFCEFLIDRGLFGENPTKRIKLGKITIKPPRHLNESEIALMLDLAVEHNVYDLIWLPLNTAMRLDEIRKLQWSDWYWEQRLIILDETKSKRPRVIPISNGLYAYFWPRRQSEGLLFPGRGGSLIDKWTLIHRIKPITRAIPKFTAGMKARETGRAFHLLRHTAATWLAMNGVELVKIQHLLGHKSITTTERYSYFQPSRWDACVNKILPASLRQHQNPNDRADQGHNAHNDQASCNPKEPLAQPVKILT